MLLQDPGPEAAGGFASKHNDDPTAHNVYRLTERATLGYDISLHWNVVPWRVSNIARPPRSLLAEGVRAQPYLVEMLDLLPEPPTEVVLMGRRAVRAWERLVRRAGRPARLAGATVSTCPHPSPLSYPRHHGGTGRGNSDLIVEAMRGAAQRARGEKARPPAGGPGGKRRPF